MLAKVAKKITEESKGFKKKKLEKIFEGINERALEGNSNFAFFDWGTQDMKKYLIEELILLGYEAKDGHTCIEIKW
jgi:hypothetical protein